MATCEIISVGTEILLGDILNTAAQFLSIQLALMGISVLHQTTVGDNPERLREALGIAASRNDIIITSGGLGPTPDDLTKEICCEFFSKKCVLHRESLEKMSAYFASKGLEMTENNKKQAMLPADCTVFTKLFGEFVISQTTTAPPPAVQSKKTASILLCFRDLPVS